MSASEVLSLNFTITLFTEPKISLIYRSHYVYIYRHVCFIYYIINYQCRLTLIRAIEAHFA